MAKAKPKMEPRAMFSQSPFALVEEMQQAPALMRAFDPAALAPWAARITAQGGRLLMTGEGSSRILPAKNMIARARELRHPWHIFTEGARQAAEIDLSGHSVIGASNSGRTRELIELFSSLSAQGVARYGITAAHGSALAEVAQECHVLSCGAERAVAASKSVIEQALCCQSLLGGGEWAQAGAAADACAAVLAAEPAPEMVEAMAQAPQLYFAGRNDGVAEELALKTNEIIRQKCSYLEGTYALHGIEEVMQAGETIVLVDPFEAELDKYRRVLQDGAGLNVIAIAAFDTPFHTLRIPRVGGFDRYIQMMAGWLLLAYAGHAKGIDLDRPLRARKVGNSI